MARELEDEGNQVLKQLRDEQRQVIDSLDLKQYAVGGSKDEWAQAEAQVAAKVNGSSSGLSSVVSVKNPNSTKGNKRKSHEDDASSSKSSSSKKDKKDKKRRKN